MERMEFSSLKGFSGSRCLSLSLCRNLILVFHLFAGCAKTNIVSFSPLPDQAELSKAHYAGTPLLWSDALREVKSEATPRVLLLEHGEEALILRLNMIRSAKKSIRIQTFAWNFDEVGKLLLWELVRAHRDRGVKVEILIDHMFTEHDPKFISFLSGFGDGFQIKYFNPSANRLSPSLLETLTNMTVDFHVHNSRMHNKLFVVDDHFAITGGRNISNEYFDQAVGMNYKDRDVLVLLSDSEDLTSCLDLYWENVHSVSSHEMLDVSEFIHREGSAPELKRSDFCPFSVFSELESRANQSEWIKQKFIRMLKPVKLVSWVFDSPEKVLQAPVETSDVSQALIKVIGSSETELIIQSPYFVLSDQAQALLLGIRQRSRDLRVVVSTNSLAATDNWATYAAHYGEKRFYLEDLGLEMWEFRPIPEDIAVMMNYRKLLYRLPLPDEVEQYGRKPFKMDETLLPLDDSLLPTNPETHFGKKHERFNQYLKVPPYLSLHAKSLVVDSRVSYVGSYNLDPRSDSYNTEVGLFVEDEAFSSLLRKEILSQASPANSYLIAAKPKKPLLSALNKAINLLSEKLPFINPWPIRSHTSFRLRRGKEPVAEGHDEFYSNWEDVGNFPGLSLWAKKHVSARLFKTTGMIFKPLL